MNIDEKARLFYYVSELELPDSVAQKHIQFGAKLELLFGEYYADKYLTEVISDVIDRVCFSDIDPATIDPEWLFIADVGRYLKNCYEVNTIRYRKGLMVWIKKLYGEYTVMQAGRIILKMMHVYFRKHEKLLNVLEENKGRIFHVLYVKKNGEEREMTAQLGGKVDRFDYRVDGKFGHLTVKDIGLEKPEEGKPDNRYRKINLGTVKKLSVNKKVYSFT